MVDFKRAMVICSAISVFALGGAALLAGLNTGLNERFSAFQQSLEAAAAKAQANADAAVGMGQVIDPPVLPSKK